MENNACRCGCGTEKTGGEARYIDGRLSRQDRFARLLFRIGISRMNMAVQPGLYAIGSPEKGDPVIVTANLRITFDLVRSAVRNRNLWLLVLDTRGVNVWCAAGKGTFGTGELVRQIRDSSLDRVVSHRKIILPQLGAPGIEAPVVEKQTGFRVYYGPVSAADLPGYLDAGMKASPEMRLRFFPFSERLELVPLECIQSWKGMVGLTAISLLLSLILSGTGGLSWFYDILPPLLGVLAGAVLTPLLLPILPGRAFALKGAIAGAGLSIVFLLFSRPSFSRGFFILAGMTALSSFLAMNFTGASTYTSLSGVRKEMRIAVPIQIILGIAAIIGRIAFALLSRGEGSL